MSPALATPGILLAFTLFPGSTQNTKTENRTVMRFFVMMSVPAVTFGFSALSFFVACCTICSTGQPAEGRSTAAGGWAGGRGLARQIRVYARENQLGAKLVASSPPGPPGAGAGRHINRRS